MDTNHGRLLISILCVVGITLAVSGFLDSKGLEYTDAAMKRSLITFGIARALNGLISVAQGTEIAVQPAGLGINFTPGQVLDPVNDLLEQFSRVMLLSAASLGIQKIFLAIGSSLPVTGLVTLILTGLLILCWQRNAWFAGVKRPLLWAAGVLLFLRFSVPLLAVSEEILFHYFLADSYGAATYQLQSGQDSISELNSQLNERSPAAVVVEPGIIAKAKQYMASTATLLDFRAKVEDYKNLGAALIEHTVNLIVIFILQTVLFPLLFLWGLYHLLRRMLTLSYRGANPVRILSAD